MTDQHEQREEWRGNTLRIEHDGMAHETHFTEAQAAHLKAGGAGEAYWAIQGEPTVDDDGFIVEHETAG